MSSLIPVDTHTAPSSFVHCLPPPEVMNQTRAFMTLEAINIAECVSKHWRERFGEELEAHFRQLDDHPMFSFLIKNASPIRDLPTYRQKAVALDRYLKYAEIVRNTILNSNTLVFSHSIFNGTLKSLLNICYNGIPQIPSFNKRKSIADLRNLVIKMDCISLDDFAICAAMKSDYLFYCKINNNLLNKNYMNFISYILLHSQKIDLFEKSIKLSSVFCVENTAKSYHVIRCLMDLSIILNRIDVLKNLINLKKPYSPDHVLVSAVANNRSIFVREFLSSNVLFNEQFESTLRRTQNHFFPVGLHGALMGAAVFNYQETFDTILQERPGQAIAYLIFQDVKYKLEHSDPAQINPGEHTTFEHPNRQGMIQQLNHELALRYPLNNPLLHMQQRPQWMAPPPQRVVQPPQRVVQPPQPVVVGVAPVQPRGIRQDIAFGFTFAIVTSCVAWFVMNFMKQYEVIDSP